MSSSSVILFNFLRDIIYDPENAQLDIETLEEDYKSLGQGLMVLNNMLKEQRDFVNAVAKGDLSVIPPSKDNVLAAPIKSLHASLRHLTWQTQQVAAGDYQQKVDFMGEFTEAFNTMISQLDTRQRALEEEIKQSIEKSIALEQNNKLFTSISDSISQGITVISEYYGDILYSNLSMNKIINKYDNIIDFLKNDYNKIISDAIEISVGSGDDLSYYSLKVLPIKWENEDAKVYILDDISIEVVKRLELEHHAMYDALTGVNNRNAGMKILNQWFDERVNFILCFIDLDNLKYVNDTYGHAEGDTYIINTANRLKSVFNDAAVCRLGGDEFMVIIPQNNKNEVIKILESVRSDLIMSSENNNTSNSFTPSYSYGVVQNNEGSDVSELLSIADERMYLFKRKNKKKYTLPQ